jgi:hypothetical protein
MIYPEGFFELSLLFARRVSALTGQPLEAAILDYTHLYLLFGLDRSFDPHHPVWQAYLHGLRENPDPCAWTNAFYLDRLAQLPPKSLPNPSFGCFSYAVWPGGRVRLHFRNAEEAGLSPLSPERLPVRLEELRAMFFHVKAHLENPKTIVGGSWLYHLQAYRRLFPPAFLNTAEVSNADFQFIALWGQFVDRHSRIRVDLANAFRRNLKHAASLEEAQASFPYQVLRLESPIQDFYRFYKVIFEKQDD